MHKEKMFAFDPEELNKELQEYKQSLWALKDENSLLKVKVRRLEDTLKKKNLLIDKLGSNNKVNAKESMGQFTQKIDTLEEENNSLKEDILEKERIIRQLQRKMNTLTAYNSLKPKPPQAMRKPISLAPSRSTERSQDYGSQQEDGNGTERSFLQSDTNTLESDSSHPHKEIAILHTGFKDIIDEVAKLKASVADINEAREKSVLELRRRDKEQLNYAAMKKVMRGGGKVGGFASDSEENCGWSTSMRAKTVNGGRNVTRNGMEEKRTSKTVSRRVASAFARIHPASKTNKTQKKAMVVYKEKKHNPLAIRTCSQNSLQDETDLKLYIEGVLKDMNHEKV